MRHAILVVVWLGSVGFQTANADLPVGSFAQVRPLNEINSPSSEDHATVSSDGLEIFFQSSRPGGLGESDIYVSRRTSKAESFGSPQIVAELCTPYADNAPSLSANRLTIYFTTDGRGGEGGYDIYSATRPTREQPWEDIRNLGPIVNSTGVDAGPCISSNDLELYFHSNRLSDNGDRDIFVALRDRPDMPFDRVVALREINTSYGEFGPTLSSDGLLLLFSDSIPPRPNGRGSLDLWICWRGDLQSLFTEPINLDEFSNGSTVNSPYVDLSPELSSDWPADEAKLYFSSERPGGSGDRDLWEATWIVEEEHAVRFQRGDSNGDASKDISDAVTILVFLFVDSQGAARCQKAMDADDTGDLNVTDAVYLLNYLFLGGPLPAEPFLVCGPDPTPDTLSCERFDACETQ